MNAKEKIYEAFGELLYVVAKADGIIHKSEIAALEKLLKGHPGAQEIKWSFDYEHRKNNDIEDLYKKVIIRCQENGPDREYEFLIHMMEEIAKANQGIGASERDQIDFFINDLLDRFKEDIHSINDLK